MTQDVAVAGVDSYALKGKETTYGNEASSIDKHFGIVQRVSPNARNNQIQVRGFKGTTTGGRAMIKALGGKFETGFSVEFQPSNFEWMEDVLGSVSGAGTSGDPYVYVKATSIPSYSISTNIDLGSIDQNVTYLGCVINSCSIRATMGEAVSVSLEYMAASLTKNNTLDTAVALDTKDVFIFSGVTLEWPDGTSVSEVIDSVEVTITNNSEIQFGLGSRTGKKAVQKQLDYSVKFTIKLEDDDFIDDFLGDTSDPATNPTRVANMGLKFSNSASHYVDMVFTGLTIDERGSEQSYSEVIPEDITAIAESLTVTEVQS